jgi:hypothetical protein
MDLMQFHQRRRALQVNAAPARRDHLSTVEENLRDLLMDSGLFEEVEVEHTDDPNQLVIGLCQFRPDYTEGYVAAQLEAIWADRLRYPFWEAHAILADEDHVEFEAASRVGPAGHYVTVHLVAQKARIPEQRVSEDSAG